MPRPTTVPGWLFLVCFAATANAETSSAKVETSPAPGSIRISPADGMALVFIPAGRFLMGSSEAEIDSVLADCNHCKREWFAHEVPQHQVYLGAYWIDKTEVTNAQFARFVAATSYKTDGERLGSGIVFSPSTKDWRLIQGADWRHPQGPQSSLDGLAQHPVVHVTQNDAMAYCEWAGRRLPTEAEWEKASRGTDGREYPWGNGPPANDLANFADRNLAVWGGNSAVDDGYSFTAPVGSYPRGASPYGVLDMAGNAGERVADRHGETFYAVSPTHNPVGPWTGEYIVTRGGSWSRASRFLRAAHRVRYYRMNRASALGFRCAVSDPIPSGGGTEEHLILGSALIPAPPPDLTPDLAALLGRWEGFDESPPVRKDLKIVLVIQQINAEEGFGSIWMGTNLQFPSAVQEVLFRVHRGVTPEIELEVSLDGKKTVLALAHDHEQDTLTSPPSSARKLILHRNRKFTVHTDYAGYLAGKRIQAKLFPPGSTWLIYGRGYLLYLPEGYDADPKRNWPLLVFLHGAGDRGENLLALAKASPFMMIREKGPLPFIIVAPLLGKAEYLWSFSESYLDGVLEMALAEYRVDPKRIYLTGLSMGGEATYRWALHRPGTFAAIAPLAAFVNSSPSMEKLRDMPTWAIHGAKDTIIPLTMGRKPVDALRQVGNPVRFDVLENHDHDVWTDTYSDTRFYEWLLQLHKP